MTITFAHVQSATGDADPAQATLTVTAGNKLVAVAMDRSGGDAANFTISDTQSGVWTNRVARTIEQGNSTFRRTLVAWERTVTAGASITVTVDDGTANTKRVVVSEFEHGAVSATWTFEAAASADNGATANAQSLATGTTSSVPAGDQLLVGIFGWKDAASSFDPIIDWTSSALANAIDTWTSNGRSLHVGWAQESASGAKASTATNTLADEFNNGLAAAILVFSASEGGGGTVTTTTLTDTLTVSDGPTIFSTVYGLLFGDDVVLSDGLVASAIRGRLGQDTLDVTDGNVATMLRNVIAQSSIAITDELLSQVVGNNILQRVLTSQIDVTDGAVFSILRNRLLQDTIIVSEGATEQYTTSNIVVDDELTVTDSIVTRLLLTRLLGDSIDLSDSAIAAIVGQNVMSAVLSSSILTSDEAVRWMVRTQVGSSTVLTADEIVKVMRFTRELTDAIDAADESLTALQRFILLTDALSVDDGAVATYIPDAGPVTHNPVFRIGFDQPRIETGGYAVI